MSTMRTLKPNELNGLVSGTSSDDGCWHVSWEDTLEGVPNPHAVAVCFVVAQYRPCHKQNSRDKDCLCSAQLCVRGLIAPSGPVSLSGLDLNLTKYHNISKSTQAAYAVCILGVVSYSDGMLDVDDNDHPRIQGTD